MTRHALFQLHEQTVKLTFPISLEKDVAALFGFLSTSKSKPSASVRIEQVKPDLFKLCTGDGPSGHETTIDDLPAALVKAVIKGLITVPNALVRLPEASRDLHEVEGESKLWNLGLMPRDGMLSFPVPPS